MPCSKSSKDGDKLPPYSPRNPFRLSQVKNPWTPPAQRWISIKTTITVVQGADITDDVIAQCLELFNSTCSFGAWSQIAKSQNNKIVPGKRLRTNMEHLRKKCVPCEEKTTIVRIYIQNKLVGYASGTRWPHYELDGDVCWITQVVVDKNYRGVGLATSLMSRFRRDTDVLYGIMSHHPAAIMALKRAVSGSELSSADLLYTQSRARDVLQKSTINFLQATVLHGTLFNEISRDPSKDEIVCCVTTDGKLAYDDAFRALGHLEQEKRSWEFGKLHSGYQFIALIENGSWMQGEMDCRGY